MHMQHIARVENIILYTTFSVYPFNLKIFKKIPSYVYVFFCAFANDATVCISFDKRFYFIFLNYIVSVRETNLIRVKVSSHHEQLRVRIAFPFSCIGLCWCIQSEQECNDMFAYAKHSQNCAVVSKQNCNNIKIMQRLGSRIWDASACRLRTTQLSASFESLNISVKVP